MVLALGHWSLYITFCCSDNKIVLVNFTSSSDEGGSLRVYFISMFCVLTLHADLPQTQMHMSIAVAIFVHIQEHCPRYVASNTFCM